MSFGSLSGQRDRSAQPGRRRRRLPAQHRRGRGLAVPPPRAATWFPDRHGLLRLPRRPGPVQPAPAEGARGRARRSGPWRSSSARAPSPASAGCCRRRRSRPRSRRPAASRGRRTASARRGTPSSTTSTRCSTSSSCSPRRPACRSASSPPWATSTFWQRAGRPDGARRPRRRLHHHRRRRGRHRGLAADLHRRRVAAVPARVRPRLRRVRRARSARGRHVHRRRQARPARQRGRRLRARRDMVNVGREAMLAVGCIQAQKCHTGSARPASRPRTRGSPTGSTRSPRPNGWPTTSRPCAATCSRSPRPAGSSTRP